MTVEDMAALDIHPATLQYATRIGTESRFWSRDRSLLSKKVNHGSKSSLLTFL